MRSFSRFTLALTLLLPACGSPEHNATKGKGSAGKEEGKTEKESRFPPCHPGCFPAGTMVATPLGPRPIESIRSGEQVSVISPDGSAVSGRVDSTFQTCNRLVEVRTDRGNLLTTETQPLCLRAGGFRPAGELSEGDVIWRWEADGRRPARVVAVSPAVSEARVFNLVVGESSVFVAGGFLARGKPPLDGAE